MPYRAADGDERHGPFLPKGDYEDEVQCDSNFSPSPLLKHYRLFDKWGSLWRRVVPGAHPASGAVPADG